MIVGSPPTVDEFRGFVRGELTAAYPEIVATGRVPAPLLKRMAEMGAFRLTAPEALGGFGMTLTDSLPYLEISAEGPGAGRMFVHVMNMIWRPVAVYGNRDQQATISQVGSGRRVLALGVTERNGGGGRDLSSRGEETDGGWSISGEKHLITFGAFASDIILLVATDERKAADSFSAFMLPTDIGGFVVEREQETMGLPGIGLAALRFDCMRAVDDQMLGPQGKGLEVMGSFLDYSRISLCSCMVGFAQSALDEAVRFAHSRTTFGSPIADRQAIQVQLADAFADITAARALVSDLAGHADAGKRIGVLSAAGKLFCQQMVTRVTDHALRVHGGLGYTKGAAISRIYEESRAFWFEEGTAETQQIIIARSLKPA